MAIRRNISVLNYGVVADIDIVYGSDLVPIEFYITDYVVMSNAIATLYCTTPNNNVYKRVGTILNNVISFDITNGFFGVGKNRLQIRITANEKNLYSFELNVNCNTNSATDDANEVESQPTLVTQLLSKVAESNQKVEDALLEVEETKEEFKTKVEEEVTHLHNPNLFINGNFQIWSNGESFDVYGANNEEFATLTCDRWYAKHYDIENEYVITKDSNGMLFTSESTENCYVYQVLDEETFNALQGKTLTLSWAYTRDDGEIVANSKQIEMNSELDIFTERTRIGMASGYILHWAKLEVGEVTTPCIPDSKDVIVCKLENSSVMTSGEVKTMDTLFGKPVYTKSYRFTDAIQANTVLNYPHGITDAEYIWVDLQNSFFISIINGLFCTTAVETRYHGQTAFLQINVDQNSILCDSDGGWNDGWIKVVTLRYTKTTD